MTNGITLAPTLYLERVTTTDSTLWNNVPPSFKPTYPTHYDVIAKDVFGNVKARWPWHYSNKPDKRYKYVMHNCSRYNVIWEG